MSNPFAIPQAGELPRDRWGRPLISPPDGGEPVAYTRASTAGKPLEDMFHLGQWSDRMVALGMSKRPDLVLAASAIDDPKDRGQKKTLQDIAKRAKDSAAPSAADIGTALHRFSERVDSGEPLEIVPDEYRPDIAAYRDTIKELGFEVASMETFVVNDELRIGGSYDRLFRVTREMVTPYGTLKPGDHIIGDVKTGSSVELGAAAFSVQLGIYAHGVAYDHTTGTRTPLPESTSKTVGVVLHMPAGQGICAAHWLNIGAGFEVGIPLALEVKAWRNRKDMIAPATQSKKDKSLPELIREAATVAELTKLYRRNQKNWTPGLTTLAATRKAELETSK